MPGEVIPCHLESGKPGLFLGKGSKFHRALQRRFRCFHQRLACFAFGGALLEVEQLLPKQADPGAFVASVRISHLHDACLGFRPGEDPLPRKLLPSLLLLACTFEGELHPLHRAARILVGDRQSGIRFHRCLGVQDRQILHQLLGLGGQILRAGLCGEFLGMRLYSEAEAEE